MNKYRSAMEKIIVTSQMEENILRNLTEKKEYTNVKSKSSYQKWLKPLSSIAACFAIILAIVIIYPTLKSNDYQTQNLVSSSKETKELSKGEKIQAPEVSEEISENIQYDKQQQGESKASEKSESNDCQFGQQDLNLGTVAGLEENNEQEEQNVSGGSPIVDTQGIEELKKTVPFELLVPNKLPNGYKVDSTSVIIGEMAQIIYSNGEDSIVYRVAKGTDDVSGDYNDYGELRDEVMGDRNVTLKGNNSLISLATWTEDDFSYSLSFSVQAEEDDIKAIIGSIGKE
ncbi:hypothetical protein [Anaerovorax odorimutans]|uniref:hypothetical protein n=1 Tax=Anaerovorax odorimutans TaxID=109327 RepID=UPI000423792A|nr:hypothetical protein [Anaerovorax odorimutans]